jgi:AraC-like DNA-binding protein
VEALRETFDRHYQRPRPAQPVRLASPMPTEHIYDRMRLTHVRAADEGARVRLPVSKSSTWPFTFAHAVRGTSTLTCEATEVILRQGEVVIVGSSVLSKVSVGPRCEFLLLRIPGETIGPPVRSIQATVGRVLSGETGSVHLVTQLLTALAEQSDGAYAPENPGRLAQHVVGLITLMCAEVSPDSGSSRAALLERAKEYIEVHLSDLDLSPNRVAAAQNVSTRTLHRLFQSEGLTITGWTRERRLEHCRVELADSAYADLSVSDVGARWGLWDAAHFSRLFKAVYGLSPMAYRTTHMPGKSAKREVATP